MRFLIIKIVNKISDVTFVLIYIISISIAALLISTQPNVNSSSKTTEISADTSEKKILQLFYPSYCEASSTLSDGYSCR